MTSHLSSEEFMNAVEGTLTPEREAHLSECTRCRAEVAELRAVVGAMRADEAPEPSPFFWPQITERIRQATTGAETVRKAAWWHIGWKSWAVASIAVGAVLAATAIKPAPRTTTAAPVAVNVPATTDDAAWDSVAALTSTLSTDDVQQIVAATPDVASRVSDLTPAERQTFVRLVQQELGAEQ